MYSRVNPARRLNHAIFVTMAMSGSAVWLGQATPRIAAGRDRLVRWVTPLPLASFSHSRNLVCPDFEKPSCACLRSICLCARRQPGVCVSLPAGATKELRLDFGLVVGGGACILFGSLLARSFLSSRGCVGGGRWAAKIGPLGSTMVHHVAKTVALATILDLKSCL